MLPAVLTSTFAAAVAYGVTFPHLATHLEAWGVSGELLGLNAAMPALGWFLGSFALPLLQARFTTAIILVVSLLVAIVAWLGFFARADYGTWTALRFVFGGSVGLFFRTIEFGLNAASSDDRRGWTFGLYNLAFGLGIALGAALEPVLGEDGSIPAVVVAGGFAVAALAASRLRSDIVTVAERPTLEGWLGAARRAPLPLLAGLAYGFVEDIPAYLLSIYALRNGLGSEVAAYTLTAAALGSITLPLALGILADRAGRRFVLLVASLGAAATAAVIPFALASSWVFLTAIAVWTGFGAALYTTGLAIVGDTWPRDGLSTANAAFGATYATGGLIGPLVNGAAIDLLSSHGLMVSAAAVPALLALVLAVAADGSSRRLRPRPAPKA
mgnify:CR=1 FL=1